MFKKTKQKAQKGTFECACNSHMLLQHESIACKQHCFKAMLGLNMIMKFD